MFATVALAVASLCSIAVPKLAGDLIDVCISFGQQKFDERTAKHKLDGELSSTVNMAVFCSEGVQTATIPICFVDLQLVSKTFA